MPLGISFSILISSWYQSGSIPLWFPSGPIHWHLLLPFMPVRRHLPLFVTVCSCPLLLKTIQSYQLPLFTKSSSSATVPLPSATVRRWLPSLATSVFAGNYWIWSASPSDNPPTGAGTRHPSTCRHVLRLFCCEQARVVHVPPSVARNVMVPHLRSSRRSLLYLFWPSKLHFCEV